MKILSFLALFLISNFASAGGWSAWATPSRVDIERAGGFMVYGNFGNPGKCTTTNKVYIKKDHSQYKEIYSTVLAAFMANKKIQVYIHNCEPVTWYSTKDVTYNVTIPSTAVNISN